MVIQMARQYVVQEWSNAAADSYTGYQVNRHFRKNGSAAIENYADEEAPKKVKKVKKPDLRTKEQAFEDRLDKKRVAFEKAFENGEISFEQYDLLLTEWTKSRARLDHRMGIIEKATNETTPVAKRSTINALENAANSFRVNHPFAFTVVGCLFGCGLLNLVGFGG